MEKFDAIVFDMKTIAEMGTISRIAYNQEKDEDGGVINYLNRDHKFSVKNAAMR